MSDVKRGRPAVDADQQSASVHVRLPARDFDRVDALARKTMTTMPEVIRRAVRQLVRRRSDDDEEE
jgi:predicted transcriptional regulator